MNRSALFIVSTDPRQSHRPAEAVRIAAGILPWKKIRVRLYFHVPLVHALLHQPDIMLGLDSMQRFYPILDQEPMTVFGPDHLNSRFELGGNHYHLNPVSPTGLHELQTECTWLLHF